MQDWKDILYEKIKDNDNYNNFLKTNKMNNLSRAARIGKQTEKICMLSLIIIVGYFTTRTVVGLIFNI
tara:strand:+ start:479 stop:682 length:204 start_codon:yes stop_codon:yes gene_type:complete